MNIFNKSIFFTKMLIWEGYVLKGYVLKGYVHNITKK